MSPSPTSPNIDGTTSTHFTDDADAFMNGQLDSDDAYPETNAFDDVTPTQDFHYSSVSTPSTQSVAEQRISPSLHYDLTLIGSIIKEQYFRDIDEDLVRMFEEYCRPHHAEERGAMRFAVLLRLLNKQNTMEQECVENWKVAGELKTSAEMYSWAALLSPTLLSYRSEHLASHIIIAMRQNSVRGMPDAKDIPRVDKLLTFLKARLTTDRNTLKKKIAVSREQDSKIRNIADLASNLISGTHLPLRHELFPRLAALRHKHETEQGEHYWEQVDHMIWTWKDMADDAEQFTRAFQGRYKADKLAYGDLRDSKHRPVEPQSVHEWVRVLDKQLREVPAVKGATNEQQQRPAKRPRVENSQAPGGSGV